MDIKNLITFKTILNLGSFQKAAEYLNYTQSTVSFQIQQLEQETSIKLFEKIGRKMVLTQGGKDILPYIDEILLANEKIKNYNQNPNKITGELRIAMNECLLSYKMQDVLRLFKEKAPDVKLSLFSSNCIFIRDELLKGSVDIGIIFDVGGYNNSLIIDKLSSFSMTLIASPFISHECSDFITPNQNINTSLIVSGPYSIYSHVFDKYISNKNIVLTNKIELGSIEIIKKSVASNLGISYIPRFTVENELSKGTLKELKCDIENDKIFAICAYHKNKWISPAMKLFLDLIKKIV